MQAMQEGQKAQQQTSPEQTEPLQAGEVQATVQEQQQLEQYYDVALNVIHGEGRAGDQIANMILQDKDVTAGIGNATATVLIATEKKAGKIPDDMKIQLALEIIAELSGLAVQAGALSDEEVDDSFIDAVASHAYTSYLSTKEAMGELDPRELEQSVSEAEQLMGTSVRNGRQNQQQAPQQQPASPVQGGLLSMEGG